MAAVSNNAEFATKEDLHRGLDDLHQRINRDVRHALDEALGRQSADLNRRMDRKFKQIEGALNEIKGTLRVLLSRKS